MVLDSLGLSHTPLMPPGSYNRSSVHRSLAHLTFHQTAYYHFVIPTPGNQQG